MVLHKSPWNQRMAVMVMVMFAFTISDSKGDCTVKSIERMDQPGEAVLPLLAYVSLSNNMTLGFLFHGVNAKKERDAVSLNSIGATHSVVRGGEAVWTPKTLPRLIPEGWNTFTVAVTREEVTLTLVQGEDQLKLFTLLLPRRVTEIQAEGTVARCNKTSPEWEVAPGMEVMVVLQPGGGENDQWLEVSSRGLEAAAPHISFPSSSNSKLPVPANTILRISSSLCGDYVLLKVFKDAYVDSQEVVMERVPISPLLTMIVSNIDGLPTGHQGQSIHLRLMLSPPPTNDTAITIDSSLGTPDLQPIGLYVFVGVLLAAVVFGLIIAVRCICKRWSYHRVSNTDKSEFVITPRSKNMGLKDYIKLGSNHGVQELRIWLSSESRTRKLLNMLHESNVSKVELLEVKVPEASKFQSLESLPALPDIEKVNLEVDGFTEKDLDTVWKLVKRLQPSHGYANIDFKGDISSGSSSSSSIEGEAEKSWKYLLERLHENTVKVKAKAWLPANAVIEEHLPLSFSYSCRATDDSEMMKE